MSFSHNEPALYRALTLRERLTAPPIDARRGESGAAGDSRVDRWRAVFGDEPAFRRRLAADGIDEATLRDVIAEKPEDLRDRIGDTLRWITELESVFADAPGPPFGIEPAGGPANDRATLARAFEPFLARGRSKLQSGLEALRSRFPHRPYDETRIAVALYAGLYRAVSIAVSRTLVLELNVARLRGALVGDTPEERYADFVRRMQQRENLRSLVLEYPVLAQQVVLRVEQWLAASLEFIERFCCDWELLRRALFAGRDPGPLVAIDAGMGDPHREGRSVTIARFAGGAAVVYKPRSLAVDRHFQELLQWLNRRGGDPTFRTLCVLDRGSYGWEEYVAPAGCTAPGELERFYQRCGALLAVLHALHATDFHFENVIAAGEHLVLADVEALFHPRLERLADGEAEADDAAARAIAYSVLGVGLLPQRLRAADASGSIDISGLGAVPGQLTPYDVPTLERVGTDQMAIEPARVTLGAGTHRPSLHGVDVSAGAYTESVAHGFATMYRLLRGAREELLAPDGPIAAFANDEVRVILRPTRTYAMVLATSFHPDVLHDALDREMLFDKLWATSSVPWLACAIPFECEDLRRGDIPLFTATPQSCDLWTSRGTRIDGVFAESGMTTVRRRIAELSEDDLATQLWYVRASLGSEARRPPARHHRDIAGRLADREQLVTAASSIGERLERLALRGTAGAAWVGLGILDEGHLSIEPLGADLYDGLPGVALFLAYLGMVTGDSSHTELAARALRSLRGQIARNPLNTIGAFNGLGGVIYALTHLGCLWAESELLEEARGYAEGAAALVEHDRTFDVVSGSAGCILTLLALDTCAPNARIRAIARRCGEHLLANRTATASGCGWIAHGTEGPPLTGISHGGAGIALALLRLSAVSGDERFRSAARAAIAYERSVFADAVENWPDLRTARRQAGGDAIGGACETTWCHGAPGIGIARLASQPLLDDHRIDGEIAIAMRTTRREGFGRGHSLCHGDLGNLELLLAAQQRGASTGESLRRLAAAILDDAARGGWRCGNPAGVETPGLMTGLAGIGYQLLRVSDPVRVPSVLGLAPPIAVPVASVVAR